MSSNLGEGLSDEGAGERDPSFFRREGAFAEEGVGFVALMLEASAFFEMDGSWGDLFEGSQRDAAKPAPTSINKPKAIQAGVLCCLAEGEASCACKGDGADVRVVSFFCTSG